MPAWITVAGSARSTLDLDWATSNPLEPRTLVRGVVVPRARVRRPGGIALGLVLGKLLTSRRKNLRDDLP